MCLFFGLYLGKNIICYLDDQVQLQMIVRTLIQIEVQRVVKKCVCAIDFEELNYFKAYHECRLTVGWNHQSSFVLIFQYFKLKSLIHYHVLLIIETIMTELNINVGIIDQLEVATTLEVAKLINVVLICQIERDYPSAICDSMCLKNCGLIEREMEIWKIVLDEYVMIDACVGLKGDVPDSYLRIFKFERYAVVVINRVIVCYN